MTQATWKSLRALLVEHYEEFSRRLSRRLGSQDLAEEALQDTFLRLSLEGELTPVSNPHGYLYRMAWNLAANRSRGERRRLSVLEADAFLATLDEPPNPEQEAAGRSEIRLIRQLLTELPPRRRAIFEAAWLENVPHQDIAERHGLSLRMIQMELRQAVEHIAERRAKFRAADFASAPRKLSKT